MSDTATESCLTTYHALFTRRAPGTPAVEHIEIPLIQRDYAQGRESLAVERIRDSFLDVLHGAATGGKPVCLDFVYGDVEQGTLHPLDGQQRLTTLFLLHWYLASRAGLLEQEQGWKSFTYATRASARLFCQRLANHPFPAGTPRVSEWITDQPWYLQTWRHDPTIGSMLVMLDAIHARFLEVDATAAWQRLTSSATPAISFHLLPIARMGLGDDLYIKMNSRGKPLTQFENFKARFEQLLDHSHPERAKEFALRVDGEWADVLWPLRGSDNLVDDEFVRYFQFVTELCEWRGGGAGHPTLREITSLAETVYGPGNPQAKAHLDFLFCAFDIWIGRDIPTAFDGWFAATSAPLETGETRKVVLFEAESSSVDLFAACCADYGKMRTATVRHFGWPSILRLYAVVLHCIYDTADFPRRLRIVRNLIEASSSEVRLENMPGLLADVHRVVVDGTLIGVATFNQAQVEDERAKAELLAAAPDLEQAVFQLEDHSLLRGRLFAFDLDATVFRHRAETFHRLFAPGVDWLLITAALLATGDYSRRQSNGRFFQFGSSFPGLDRPWRTLLADGSRASLAKTRNVLGRFLDEAAAHAGDPAGALQAIADAWLAECEHEQAFDWRYYFVKYPTMREGQSGLYAGANGMLGYDVGMLRMTNVRSYYRDPYLSAICRESGVQTAVRDPLFFGYEWLPRRLHLMKSGTELQCVPKGFHLQPPAEPAHAASFAGVCAAHGIGSDGFLVLPQIEKDGHRVDTRDRIDLGAQLLSDLVNAGL